MPFPSRFAYSVAGFVLLSGTAVDAEELSTAAAAVRASASPSPPTVFGPLPLRALGGFGPIFYQPLAERATTLGQGEVNLALNLHYAAISDDGTGSRFLVELDGEILRWETRLDYGITEDLQLSIIIPFHHTTGGFLDSTIDEFHSLTGLPRSGGGARNRWRHVVSSDGVDIFNVPENEFALGDIPLQLKCSVLREETHPVSVALRGGVELPTGNEKKSLGSGGVDLGLGVVVEKTFDTTSLYVSADYLYYQRAERFRDAGVEFEDFVFAASAAAEWRPRDWLGLTAQIDVLSNALADADVPELDEPQIIGSLGLSVAASDSLHLRLAFSEDMTSAATADIAVYFGLSWRLP